MSEITVPGGLLIVFEGIDGAGKTTQSGMLKNRLESLGFRVALAHEPTSGKWGTIVRNSAKEGRLAPADELHAFMEDRREHVRDFIEPSLKQDKVVILDRYFLSTAAYQGARGIDHAKILADNEAFAPHPNAVFLLDISPEIGLVRVRRRNDMPNHFERISYLAGVRGVFASIDRPYIQRLSGFPAAEHVHALVCAHLDYAFQKLQISAPPLTEPHKNTKSPHSKTPLDKSPKI